MLRSRALVIFTSFHRLVSIDKRYHDFLHERFWKMTIRKHQKLYASADISQLVWCSGMSHIE